MTDTREEENLLNTFVNNDNFDRPDTVIHQISFIKNRADVPNASIHMDQLFERENDSLGDVNMMTSI